MTTSPAIDPKPRYMTPAAAAKALQVHKSTILRALRNARVPGAHRTPGGHWRIPIAYVVAQKAIYSTPSVENRHVD